MPCPHNEITIVQRSQRQSAVAAAAYQSGEKLFCEYDQQVKHYPEKRGIVHNEILLPANAPLEYTDRNTLWNAAEAVEKQWNSQLARRWVLSIPREIPPDQYAALVRDFCRQQFVSNVSHELKTPLSSVKVLSESILLQEDVPKEMYVEFLHDITSEVDRMTAIINDLLTLVKLDQKEIPLNFKETNLTQMMTDIIKRLQPMADAKYISLQWDASKEIHAEADEMKLSLAISNLVDNAVKYTPEEGTVKVSLDADHQNVFISVADTGIGIPEDEVNRIFERFYRVDKTRDRETGGTGLGLSITHSTIMMHKGSIKVNSKEEEGTTILVRIPLKQPTTHG